ncbi:416_t:CDS:2, partial [Gigaspora margarita]
LLTNQKVRIDYTWAGLVEKDTLEDQILVVGRMQAVDALNYWQHKIGPSPVVMDWLKKSPNISKGRISISSKACAKSVQFVRRSTGMGKKGIGSVNKIYSDRVFGESDKVFWLDNRYDKDTGYGSEEQSSGSKGVDVRVSRKRKDLSSQVGLGSMVADATPYPGQLYSFVSGLDVIHKGFFRGGRTVEEPKLAVPS